MHITNKCRSVLLATTLLMALNGSAQADQKCDSDKPETTPTSRFQINAKEGTVFDIQTRLTWKICAEGMIYLNGRCTGNAEFTWDYAAKSFDDRSTVGVSPVSTNSKALSKSVAQSLPSICKCFPIRNLYLSGQLHLMPAIQTMPTISISVAALSATTLRSIPFMSGL